MQRIRPTTRLSFILSGVLAGLVAGRQYSVGIFMVLAVCALGIIALHRQRRFAALLLIVTGCLFGIYRGSTFMQSLTLYKKLNAQKIVLNARAATDGIYGDKSQLEFLVDSLKVEEPYQAQLPGSITVEGIAAPMVYKGDYVRVSGKLYATRGSRQGRVSFAKVEVIARNSSVIESIRRRFAVGLANALPEPHASFALGLLVGQRSTIPKYLNKLLVDLGLAHIVAVSGYNLTILIGAIGRSGLARSRYQRTILSIGFIVMFVAITGLSASIVRAAIVSMLSILAAYYGRAFKPHVLILTAAVMTAVWNPLYIWSDIGWYLSFLSFFGVLVVAPLLSKRLFKKEPKQLGSVLLESASAQIMTIPISLYIFGRLSLIALVSNIVIVPFIPFAMALATLAGIVGAIVPAVAAITGWPAKIIMTYMIDTVSLLGRLPHISVSRSISSPVLLLLYALVFILVLVLQKKSKSKSAIITDINAL